ncbi:MAG: tetratricopeptide repeat-containing sulfotransferase family protein, partial [Pseudomonadota bacterium]
PDALGAYGLALIEAGRPSEAEPPLKRAIERAPDRPGLRLNLAELYFRVGEEEQAIETLRRTTAEHPKFAQAFVRLGHAMVARQDLQSAAEAFDAALQLDPQDQATALILARALASAGNFGAAYHVLDHMEKIRPDDVEALKLRLEIARTRRDFPALEALAQRLTKVAPDDPTGWRDLAAAFYEGGRFEDALRAFERAMALMPRSAENLSQLASIAINALDFEKADAALAEAEAASPGDARMLSTKALLLTYQGRKEEAEAYCRRCMEADPTFSGVYPQLSLLRNGWLSDEEEFHIRAYSERADIAPGSRASAAFVVAHNRDARGDADAAFREYERANALAAERNRNEQIFYDFAGHSAWTDAIINVFASAAETGAQSHHEGPQPIFVVGLPRCGSTLVESVIAAHSAVQAGGELPMMPNIFNRWLQGNYRAGEARLLRDERERIAAAYMRGAPARFEKDRFTDKNLLNIEAAGLIAQAFPQAVIVNVRRNPVENAFAIWRQDMMKFWAYATSFEDVARRYGLYAKLVDHFERALPGRFHTIQYEDFVTGFDAEAKNLIALCRLQWEESCAEFQKARAIAPTISALQVRDEVSLKGDRAALYGARLDPLRRALEEAGVDLKSGALRA